MSATATTAWALESLALATAYGGPYLLRVAVKPSLKEIACENARGRFMTAVWDKFGPIDGAAHLTFGATYLIGRAMLKSHPLDARTAGLVKIKDLLVGGAVVTGVWSLLVGRMMKTQFPEGVPLGPNGEPSANAPKEAQRYSAFYKTIGRANTMLIAGAIAITPAIVVSAVRARRRPLIARLLGYC